MLYNFLETTPQLGQRIWIDPKASIIGDVTLGDDVSIWAFASIRGDVNYVSIGARTNIQEGTIIHVTHAGEYTGQGFPTIVGENVTIGHGAMLHGCEVGDACLIGMRSTILDGASMAPQSILGAGSLLAPNKKIPTGELWMGSPARFVRRLKDKEIEHLFYSADQYVFLKNQYIHGASQLI